MQILKMFIEIVIFESKFEFLGCLGDGLGVLSNTFYTFLAPGRPCGATFLRPRALEKVHERCDAKAR